MAKQQRFICLLNDFKVFRNKVKSLLSEILRVQYDDHGVRCQRL